MNHERAADAAAASGWIFWLASHALDWTPVLHALSLAVSILASIAALIYYISRIRAADRHGDGQ